ncbi:MAG TPA: hypothetical protein VGK04_01100 [Thermoanaerobaculia bacterium]
MRMTRLVVFAAVASLFIVAGRVQASPKPCQPPDAAYKIFFDPVRPFDADSPAGVKRLRGYLATSLKRHLESLRTERPELLPVPCAERAPESSDFDSMQVEWLNNRKVVMELWGTIDDAGNKKYDANVNVAVIPASVVALAKAKPPAIFTLSERVAETATPDELLNIFRKYRQVSAYALIGVGLRAKEEPNGWNAAYDYLCKGRAELQPLARPQDQALLQYVTAQVDQVVRGAQNDPNYVGDFKLLPPNAKGECR